MQKWGGGNLNGKYFWVNYNVMQYSVSLKKKCDRFSIFTFIQFCHLVFFKERKHLVVVAAMTFSLIL